MSNKPHPVDIAVGRAIRYKRLIARVSQTELGTRIGVTFQQIQKYEKGTNRVSASMLVEIAQALQTDVRSFFDEFAAATGKATETDTTAQSDDFATTRETISLNRAFAEIADPRLRRKILDFVRAVAGSKDAIGDEEISEAAE